MEWSDVIDRMDADAEKVAALAWALKGEAHRAWTKIACGYYWDREADLLGVMAFEPADFTLCKQAAVTAAGADSVRKAPLFLSDVADGRWIKIAYSPTLRRGLEALNFFPGQYVEGVPNHPSPLAAMLTTGLVGGGLGYGAGVLGEKLLPRTWERGKLRKTLGIAGALGGVATAAPWMATNIASGKSVTDHWPFTGEIDPEALASQERSLPESIPSLLPSDKDDYLYPLYYLGVDPNKGNIGIHYQRAVDRIKKGDDQTMPHVDDVDIDALGRTLWHYDASPELAASTMGTLYAAQQLPDVDSRPGFVTPGQLGQLAMNTGKGYAVGTMLGWALNKTLGAPTQNFGSWGAGLGALKTFLPPMFG